MKIGIISDTHDDIENVRRNIDIFNKEEVQYVIHAGDYVFPGIVMEFKNLNARLVGVLGNNDGERGLLLKAFLEVGGGARENLVSCMLMISRLAFTTELLLDQNGNYRKW